MTFRFEQGKPACEISCKYCHVTELDTSRTAAWSRGLLGINKACTFMNTPPWIVEDPKTYDRFYRFPWHLLRGDFVGWTAVTDGMMPQMRPYFWHWVEKVSPVAKLVTVVTKWPISKQFMRELGKIPNLFLVITITGNRPPIEKIEPEVHLKSLALAKEYGVRCLPMLHPYISGVSDLSFLPQLKALGYNEVCVKGLRYSSETMGDWMPDASKPLYEGHGIDEVLPNDGWQQRVDDAGLTLLSPKQWYWRDGHHLNPKCDRTTAAGMVNQLLGIAQIASSSSAEEVRESAIARRL